MINFDAGKLSGEFKSQLLLKLNTISAQILWIQKVALFLSIKKLPDENVTIGGVSVKELKEKLGSK